MSSILTGNFYRKYCTKIFFCVCVRQNASPREAACLRHYSPRLPHMMFVYPSSTSLSWASLSGMFVKKVCEKCLSQVHIKCIEANQYNSIDSFICNQCKEFGNDQLDLSEYHQKHIEKCQRKRDTEENKIKNYHSEKVKEKILKKWKKRERNISREIVLFVKEV